MTTAPGVRIGIDIGGTKLHGVAIDDEGLVVAEGRETAVRGSESILDSIRRLTTTLMCTSGSTATSVGIGIPGQIDARRGIVRHSVNLDLVEWEITAAVAEATGIRPQIANDVNAAVLGAKRELGLSGNVAYLNIGTGVAAGVVVGSNLIEGCAGAAGEIGHLVVDPAGPSCDCGQRGCIEAVSGGLALARALPGVPHPVLVLLERAEAGDAFARDILDRFTRGVVAALRALQLTVDVDHIVVGGGIATSTPRIERLVRAAVALDDSRSPFLASLALEDRLSFLPRGLRVPAIGAALLSDRSPTRSSH